MPQNSSPQLAVLVSGGVDSSVARQLLHAAGHSYTALLTDVLNEIWDLRAFVGERFDSLDSRITHLEDDLGFIHRCFNPPTDP